LSRFKLRNEAHWKNAKSSALPLAFHNQAFYSQGVWFTNSSTEVKPRKGRNLSAFYTKLKVFSGVNQLQ